MGDLEPLTGAAAQALEPELFCVAALLSPSTGIIDSHALMLAYQGDAEAAGAVVALLTYLGVFLAGARVAWIVHTLWLLPVASVVLAFLPRTKRWLSN